MAKENYDIIDQYLSSKLEGEALTSFEQQLASDPVLRQEVEDRTAMKTFLHNLEKTKAFKAKLEGIEGKYFLPDGDVQGIAQPANKIPWFWLVLIGLLLAAFFLYKNVKTVEAPISYPSMAMHEPLSLTQKSGEAEAQAILDFSTHYNAADYATALPLIDAYLANNSTDNEVLLAKGICELELDQVAAARKTFSSIATGGSIYRDLGTWYLALSYLKVGDQEKMKSYLRQIPSTATDLYEKAQELLQQ